jgi:hypothetical protein
MPSVWHSILKGGLGSAQGLCGQLGFLSMTSRVGDIIIDCNDPELLAGFWCGVLGYRMFARDETGVAIRGATVSPDILFIRVAEGKPDEPRTVVGVPVTAGVDHQPIESPCGNGMRLMASRS